LLLIDKLITLDTKVIFKLCAWESPVQPSQKHKLRLFGKPKSFNRHAMGVVLAFVAGMGLARGNAKLAASKVKLRVA